MEISRKNFLKLPEVPGVYTFWNKNTPIYIGKSVNLKARLNSYLAVNLGPKTKALVKEAEKVTFVEVTSELESLLLESYLIKKHKPKYNIVLKDDKHALYIVITKEEFPRVLAVRKLYAIPYTLYAIFGPFPNSTNVKTILKLIRKIFPYSDHKIGKKPCLYAHLGLCNPCPNLIINNQTPINKQIQISKYKSNIKQIKLVLSRKFNVVRKYLEIEMQTLSKQQNYEEAKVARDKIKVLDYITQNRIETEKFLENPNLAEDVRAHELSSLRAILNYKFQILNSLKRIECYDISHLVGVMATASMVVAINGEMEHAHYRHFKIRQKNSQSDYDSLREIARRRIKHIEDHISPTLRGAGWDKPDLVIVDGGLGQVKVFDKEFKNCKIPVVGIAKNPDRLVFPDGKKVRLQGETLQVVSRIRDEAHRFAKRLHHKLISSDLFLK